MIELLIVLLIVGVLATLALTRHQRMVACNTLRMAERTLHTVLDTAKTHFIEEGDFPSAVEVADLQAFPMDDPNARGAERSLLYTFRREDRPVAGGGTAWWFIARADWQMDPAVPRWIELAQAPYDFGLPPIRTKSAWCGPEEL